MARKYEGKIQFIGMAGRDSEDAMRGFVDKYGIDFPQTVSTDGALWGRFGVPGQPSWVFVDDSGGSEVYLGAPEPEELQRRLDELVSG